MTLQERKDIVDKLSKIADVVNKKLIVKEDGKLKVLSKRLETFFEQDPDINRDENIKKAYQYGYTKSEIADFLELNPSTISRII